MAASTGLAPEFRRALDRLSRLPELRGYYLAGGEAYVRRFGVAEADLYHVLRSLTYFEDAERDPILPRGMLAAEWLAIKGFFQEQAPAVLRGYRG